MIYANDPEVFQKVSSHPDWVKDWLVKRGKIDEAELKAKEAANAIKRQQSRDKRILAMAAGMDDLEQWINDLVRQGLASTEGQEYNYWHSISSRMVDSKLAGIGRRIRKFPLF